MFHFRSLSENRPNCFVNQFPSEMLLTVKDALAVVARRVVSSSIGSKYNSTLETEPSWLPTTFNLVTELPNSFHISSREKKSEYTMSMFLVQILSGNVCPLVNASLVTRK